MSINMNKKEKIPIIAYKVDEDYNIIEEKQFKSPQEASSKLKLDRSSVERALENEEFTTNGWHLKKNKLWKIK